MATRPRSIAICTVQTLFTSGGAERAVGALERELCDRGHSVEVVRIPFAWTKPDLLQQALVWRLLKVEADLVIATNFPSYFVKHANKIVWLFHQYRPLYELYGTPYSAFGHEAGDPQLQRTIAAADTRMLGEARRLLTTSRNVARRLQRHNGLSGEPLYHPPPLWRSLRCEEYGDFILMPTRFEPHKRPALLLEALRRSRSDVKAVIVGTGSLESDVRTLAEDYGLEDRIQFAGFVDDGTLLKLYASCRAVFYAPYDEDYGYVTLEAFLARKPVVTTPDAGGVLEFVSHERTGLVAEPRPEALARAIDRLADSVDVCRRLGDAGRDAVSGISWDHVIRRLVDEPA